MNTRPYLSTAAHSPPLRKLVIQFITPGAVPMSTPNTRHTAPTLNRVHAHLLEIDPTLRAYSKQPVALPQERIALDQINNTLKRINDAFAIQARALYQGLDQADLTQTAGQQLLERLKTSLNKNLQNLDETSVVAGQSRKTYLTSTAGISALELETLLNVNDYLLSPARHQGNAQQCDGRHALPGKHCGAKGDQDRRGAP